MTHLRINLKTVFVNLGPGSQLSFWYRRPWLPDVRTRDRFSVAGVALVPVVSIWSGTDFYVWRWSQRPLYCLL